MSRAGMLLIPPFLLLSSFHTSLFASSPWPLLRYDRQGTNHDAAVVGYATGFGQALSLPLANGDDDNILLGDVNGDGLVEIVILEGASLSVYDYTGATLATIDVSGVSYQGLGMLTDIDADGVLEMGVGFNLQDYAWGCRFYNLDGTIAYQFQKTNPGSDCYASPQARFDNGDLFVKYSAIWSGGSTPGRRGVCRWSVSDDQEVWDYTTGSYNYVPGILDIDNDGLLEIALDSWTTHNGSRGNGWNGNGDETTDGELSTIVINEDGTQQYTRGHGGENGRLLNSMVDFDGDGTYEVLSRIGHDPTYYHGTSHLDLYDVAGNLVATHQGATDGHWGDDWGDVVVDIDDDGDEECVVSNWSPAGTYTLVLGAGLTVLDSTSMSGGIMLAADILSNPGLELILRYGSTLKITDLAFNELWSVTTGGIIGRRVRTADLDGDGWAELIFESDRLYVYSGTGLGIGDGPAFSTPKGFTLRQNYPNPFNPSTTITFDIPGVVGERRPVTLGVYDLRGRLVRTLMAGDMDPGRQAVHWDGRDDRGESVSSGMYLYRLRMGEETRVRKMTLLK